MAAQADALNREHRLVHAALAAAGNDAKLSFGEYAEAKLLVSSRCVLGVLGWGEGEKELESAGLSMFV